MPQETERCKWQHPLDASYECPEPRLPSSKDEHCIFHEQSKEKDEEAFLDGIERKRDDHDFDFSGYYFPRRIGLFERFEFDKDVSFTLATFCGSNTLFSGAEFLGNKTDFSFAEFCGDVWFTSAVFSGNEANFAKARFSGENTGFAGAHFRAAETNFSRSTFAGHYTDFLGAHFSRGRTDFSRVRFSSSITVFTSAALKGITTSFENAHLSGQKTEFRGTYFSSPTAFGGAVFSANETDFHGARFGQSAIDFTRARFYSTWTDFSGVNLSNSRFVNARWARIDFTDAQWNRRPLRRWMCWNELNAKTRDDLQKAQSICRNIKQAYQGTGDYETAGEFYYGEMECRLKCETRVFSRLWLTLLKLVCGYGEKPLRVVVTWLLVVWNFTLIYAFTGIAIRDGDPQRLLLPLLPLREIPSHLWRCLYFSGVTFTTLGFGDLAPASGISQLFAVLEASLGAFLMALFILVVGRKLLR